MLFYHKKSRHNLYEQLDYLGLNPYERRHFCFGGAGSGGTDAGGGFGDGPGGDPGGEAESGYDIGFSAAAQETAAAQADAAAADGLGGGRSAGHALPRRALPASSRRGTARAIRDRPGCGPSRPRGPRAGGARRADRTCRARRPTCGRRAGPSPHHDRAVRGGCGSGRGPRAVSGCRAASRAGHRRSPAA